MSDNEQPANGNSALELGGFPELTRVFAQAGHGLGQRYVEWQREIQDFVAKRVKADVELPTSIAGCRNPVEMLKMQQEWFARAMRDYADETARLARIGVDTVHEGMNAWSPIPDLPGRDSSKAA